MPSSRFIAHWCLAATLFASLAWPAPAATSRARAADAISDSLLRAAAGAFSGTDLDRRRRALDGLTEATRCTPARSDVWLAHGQACLNMGRVERARSSFERATRLAPEDALAWHELAIAWRNSWLLTAEVSYLDEALRCHARALELDPQRNEDWVSSAMLLVLRGRSREAIQSGLRAQAADPDGAAPWLALGAALFRAGQTSLADHAFERARAVCSPELRRRLDGSEPLDEADAGGGFTDPSVRPAAWLSTDPDFTTAENEALLDYRTRVALALFLFEEDGQPFWDLRTQLFVRYGPPSRVVYNSAESQLGFAVDLAFHFPRRTEVNYAPPPLRFPYHMQYWIWDELGLAVVMWDRSLEGRYDFPVELDRPREARPDPGALAMHPDLMAVGDGSGVYRRIAPGLRPMRVTGRVTRFPQANGTRLLVHAFAPAQPSDSLFAACAVVAHDGRVVARQSHPLSGSACDPARGQVADFSVSVPAGDYLVDVSVSDARGRRGLARVGALVEPSTGLGLSDPVIMCQDARLAIGENVVRIEPALGDEVGSAAALYYELDGLDTSRSGEAHFQYSYSVLALEKDGSVASGRKPFLSVTREETSPDPHRRQLVNLPLNRVPPGRYAIELEIRDLSNGASLARRLEFTRLKAH